MVKNKSKILILVALILMLFTMFSSFAVQNKKESVKADTSSLLTLNSSSNCFFAKSKNKLVPVEHTSYNPSETIYVTYSCTLVNPPTNTLINTTGNYSDFISTNFENDIAYINVYKSTGALITSAFDSMATGCVIKLYSSSTEKTDENLIDEITVVILGDLNGDGRSNQTDVNQLTAYIQGTRTLSNAQFYAMDLNNDGYVDQLDLDMLDQARANKRVYTVVYQTPPAGVSVNTVIILVLVSVLSVTAICLCTYIAIKHRKKFKKQSII